MLTYMSDTIYGFYERRNLRVNDLPPIALTEYSSVFRQTPACGGAQQYISFLWQSKFIGQAVLRRDFVMMNHFAARAIPVKCTGKSDFEGYQVEGAGKRAPMDSYSLIQASKPEWGIPAKPSVVYYAFWLWNRYMGYHIISHLEDRGTSAFVSEFKGGELGIMFVNTRSDSHTIEWGSVIRWWMAKNPDCKRNPVTYFNGHLGEADGDGGYPGGIGDCVRARARARDLSGAVVLGRHHC